MEQAELKSARLLELYTRLERGEVLKKSDLAQEFHVTQRSIQRDVEELRWPAATDALLSGRIALPAATL